MGSKVHSQGEMGRMYGVSVYLERCIVSVFFKENDCEYQCNSDAFIDRLLEGEMLSVRNYTEKEIYPYY